MAESSWLARGTARPGEPIRSGPLERLLTGFASYFEVWRPRARARRLPIAMLGLIVALGAVLRFWGLGSVGLHGDEDTMALATLHILRHGVPGLPSGMFYPRGTGQLYLMAASVLAFGASEWALRLPSALCGVLLIPLAFLAGRRFLARPWNLAFTAAVALLPAFIEDAQTARMYVFLVTSVAAFAALVFEWERTGRSGWLAAAVAVLVIGIQFHELAVFAAFLVLYPGLVRADARKLALGSLAFAVIVACYFLISGWISSSYPDTAQLAGLPAPAVGALARAAAPRIALAPLIAGGCIAVALAAWVARGVRTTGEAVAAGALIFIGLGAQLLAFDHVGFVALAAAAIVAARSGSAALRRTGVVLFASAAWLAFQLWRLHAAGVGVRQSVGAVTGWPSIWPYLALAKYSPAAAVAVAAGVVFACWRLARRQTVPDFFLFLALGVWVPLLMIGVFKWSVPIRYVAAESFPMLLGAFAAAQWLARPWRLGARAQGPGGRMKVVVAATAACLLAANPASLGRSVYSGYANHPDHQGAALFIRAQHPGPRDILVAEDPIEQTYYLGHVDYWLEGLREASSFAREVNGRLEDIYTGAPVIGTGEALERLIARRNRGTIYIIGSGEQQQDGRSLARGPGIQRILHSLSRDVVYVGRDGLTKVWKIPARASARTSASSGSQGRSGGRG